MPLKIGEELFSGKRFISSWPMVLCVSFLSGIFLFNNPKVLAELSHGGLPKVTFEVKDTPFNCLVHDFLNSTGYTIKGCEKWDDVRVTLKVQGTPLDEVVRSVLKRAGIINYVMSIDEVEKRITLRRLETFGGGMARSNDAREKGILSKEGHSDFTPPPEINEAPQALNSEEILDREITPPSEPGGKGMTLRELEGELPVPQDPMDKEITPPSENGGRGLTLRELMETSQ